MVEDVKDTQEGREREDKLFVSNIMSLSMGLNVKIKKTQRIGIFTKERQEKNNYIDRSKLPWKMKYEDASASKSKKVKWNNKHQSNRRSYQKRKKTK